MPCKCREHRSCATPTPDDLNKALTCKQIAWNALLLHLRHLNVTDWRSLRSICLLSVRTGMPQIGFKGVVTRPHSPIHRAASTVRYITPKFVINTALDTQLHRPIQGCCMQACSLCDCCYWPNPQPTRVPQHLRHVQDTAQVEFIGM